MGNICLSFEPMSWKINEEKPLFTIGAVADILGIKHRMLRLYEENGLLLPNRSQTNRRQYSLKDIAHIAYLNYLNSVKKVNLSGLVEIQKILGKMTEEQTAQFMDEIEKEIQNLPKEEKKRFVDPSDVDFEKAKTEFEGLQTRPSKNNPEH